MRNSVCVLSATKDSVPCGVIARAHRESPAVPSQSEDPQLKTATMEIMPEGKSRIQVLWPPSRLPW